MAHQALIDPREYERVTRFVKEYHLAEHDSRLGVQLRMIDAGTPAGIDAQLWEAFKGTIRSYEDFHRDIPFVTAPPASLHIEGVSVLRQYADRAPVPLAPSELARNLLILGSTGSGKTSILLTLADNLLHAGYDVWYFDVKRDSPRLAVRHERVLVLHPDAPVDLFAKPPYLSTSDHVATIVETLTRATYGGQAQRAITHEIFTRLFNEHDRPTITDALDLLAKLPRKGDTYDRQNAIRNCHLRLQRLRERYPGLATRGGVPAYTLCDYAVLFPFVAMSDIEEFLVAYLVTTLFHHHRTKGIRDLRTLIAFDESLLLFRGEGGTSRISGNNVAELIGLTREFGTGWALTANAAHLLDPAILANMFGIIALNASSNHEADLVTRLAGLTKDQAEYYRLRLTRGQAIVRLGDRYRHPILATADPWPHDKTITPSEWATATARITALLPPPRPAPAPPPTSMPPAPQVALNAHAASLLTHASTQGVVLTTEAFRDLVLHPQAGMRAKRQLLALAFIEEERIVVHRRRGGTAVAIRPTASGYARAGIKRRGTRGGDSVQHEYLVRTLAARIPGARIDALVGTKACDLLIPYQTGHHERLATILGITPGEGALIAIEVEVSDPHRTAPSNIARNKDAGIAHTIIATMTPWRRIPPGVVVMDVFALLEAL